MTDLKLAVLGVGLIGGSIGLAAHRRGGVHVTGYDPDAGALSAASDMGAIDRAAGSVADAVSDAEVVFVAAPVGVATATARLALDAASAECVLSDVGSTKREIARAISDPRFVGGHPLAGAETAGVENARGDLFDGATWYLTPTAGAAWRAAGAAAPVAATAPPTTNVAPWAVERLRALIVAFGARPVTIDPRDHDRLMANVSHLPHVFANVLVARALRAIESDEGSDVEPEEESGEESHVEPERESGEASARAGALGAGPSFRDATRVAGANTAIWTDIYMSNRDLLAEAVAGAIEQLGEVRDALQDADAERLAAWNERARAAREQLGERGAVGPGAGPTPGS